MNDSDLDGSRSNSLSLETYHILRETIDLPGVVACIFGITVLVPAVFIYSFAAYIDAIFLVIQQICSVDLLLSASRAIGNRLAYRRSPS
jgi:hypothetical protein